jgi:hypothetical protein
MPTSRQSVTARAPRSCPGTRYPFCLVRRAHAGRHGAPRATRRLGLPPRSDRRRTDAGRSDAATRAQLPSGESAAFTLQVVVDPATADQTTITNTATAASAIHDPNSSDDISSVSTTVAIPATPTPETTATATPTPVVTATPTPTPGGDQPGKIVVCRRVPRLRGKTYRAAKRALERHRCKVRRVVAERTRVRSQRPKPGTTVYKGERVRVRLR